MLEDLKDIQRSCFSVGPVEGASPRISRQPQGSSVAGGLSPVQTDWRADIRSYTLLVHFLRQYAIKPKEPTQICVVLKSVYTPNIFAK